MSAQELTSLASVMATSHAVANRIDANDLTLPTPNTDQDVAGLLMHLIGWQRVFLAHLLDGATSELVDGSPAIQLGPDPAGDLRSASSQLLRQLELRADDTVDLPYRGDTRVADLISELTAEILLHSWDLARAVGAPFDPSASDIAAAEIGLTLLRNEVFGAEAFHPPVDFDGSDAMSRLLARSGRPPLPDGRRIGELG